MPNRIIKESICTSDTLAQLTAEEERLFYRLLVQVDDYGRFDGRAAIVLASCFPLLLHEISTDKIEAWLQRLAEVGLITFYHVDGRRYLYVNKWSKHQTPPRANKSKYPAPPDGLVVDKVFPDESNVEDLLVETLRASATFNGEPISMVDRQLRVKESYLDVVVRTSETPYVIEIKRSRLSNKAIKQLADYLGLLPGRGILVGCGLSGNFDMGACRDRGIAVVIYDENMNLDILHDGGFLREFPRLNVKSRDGTLSVYSITENRESRIENRETRNEEERESLSPDEPAPPSPQEIASLWNQICGDVLPKCEKMTDKRRKHIKARLAESRERHSLDWWHGYFSRIRASPFCCGQNDRGWCATFEWAICSEDNVVKVLEGKYDRKRGDLVAIRPERGPVGGVSRGPDPNSKYAAVYR